MERERLQGTQTGLDTDHVLEEKEITGFSNRNGSPVLRYKYKEIAGHSNSRDSVRRTTSGLEEDKITWYSNHTRDRTTFFKV